jgi:tetratricopeptide (TPR) repeat protein
MTERTAARVPVALGVALCVWGAALHPAHAGEPPAKTEAPAKSPAKTEAPAKPSAESGAPDPVEAAEESGDLSAAVERARAARKDDPSAANWRAEAKALEAAGRFPQAAAAYQSLLDVLPADAKTERASAEAARKDNRARARGVVEGEPASTHREALDAKWGHAGKTSPRPDKPPRRTAPPPRTDDDRIVTKWYFWVTVGAIVASAAAVTGIAIKAARDDEPDALGLGLEPRPMGPSLLRF